MEPLQTGMKRSHVLALAMAMALTGLGAVGLFGRNEGYTDALYWPDYSIPEVPPGGPLEEAGFQPGDSVVSVEGIPVTTLGMYSRWPRFLARSPGETLSMTVSRRGELVTEEIRFRERPPSVRRMQLGGAMVVLSFLWIGVWAYLTLPSPHSARLAAMGLALGFALPGPNLGTWNGVRDHLQLAGVVLWSLLLLRFFLFFPRSKRISQGHLTTLVLYLPWALLLGCLVVELLYHPRFYHSFGGFGALLMSLYALLAVAALLHTWFTASRAELHSSGMSFVLVGVGVGVTGLLVWLVDAAFLPGIDIPFSGWLPLLLVAVPLGMAWGLKKGAAALP